MFTLGHNFAPANIHAGGLRYHGAGVIVSQLLKDKLMEAVDISQLESFEAGCLFAQVEESSLLRNHVTPLQPPSVKPTSAKKAEKRK